jgi:acetate kinase
LKRAAVRRSESSCEGLDWFGLKIDPARNGEMINREDRITPGDSRLHAYVIPSEEELMIAQQAVQCLS